MTNFKESVFIGAQDGGVYVNIGAGNKVGFAKTPKMLAYILETKKVFNYENVYFTSSMDFADEEGFAHYDGAKELWDNATAMMQTV